jgi:hypothetical protein
MYISLDCQDDDHLIEKKKKNYEMGTTEKSKQIPQSFSFFFDHESKKKSGSFETLVMSRSSNVKTSLVLNTKDELHIHAQAKMFGSIEYSTVGNVEVCFHDKLFTNEKPKKGCDCVHADFN